MAALPPSLSAGAQGGYTLAQLESLWTGTGGSVSLAPTMAAIAQAESSGNPTATNLDGDGTVDYGLWQINSSNFPGLEAQGIPANAYAESDPTTNALSARALATNSLGLKNWSTWNQYQAYLAGTGPATPATQSIATSLNTIGAGNQSADTQTQTAVQQYGEFGQPVGTSTGTTGLLPQAESAWQYFASLLTPQGLAILAIAVGLLVVALVVAIASHGDEIIQVASKTAAEGAVA